MTHNLKTWPKFFAMVRSGRKTFELRVNDRNFQVGDMLVLREWDPDEEHYTGELVYKKVADVINLAPLSEYVALVFEDVQPMILRYRAQKAEADLAELRANVRSMAGAVDAIRSEYDRRQE